MPSRAALASESPALRKPLAGIDIRFWVGADERPEFLRQTRLACENWQACSDRVSDCYEPQRDHFSIMTDLDDPRSGLSRAVFAQMGVDGP